MPTFKLKDLKATPPTQEGVSLLNQMSEAGKAVNEPLGKRVNYAQIEHERKRPTLLSDPEGWWNGLTDDQKQEAIDTLGEFAGGTVGAIAGGGTPASIPGAGAGALVGRGVSAGVGKAMGLETTPKSVKQELIDAAQAFALNSGGEAIGFGAALMKPLLKRGLAKAVKADPHIAQLAEAAGVQLTPSMVSQRPLVKMVDAVLENTPGGMGTIRKKTNAAIAKNEENLRKIPEQFNPTPVDRPEAARALRDQLTENQAAIRGEFKPRYQQILADAGDAPIDMSAFRQSAKDFLEDLPPQLEAYFPADVLKKMRQAGNMVDGQWVNGGLVDSGAPILTFQEAQKLRTSLLEAERAMSAPEAALKRRAIPGLRDALDRSIDDSLSNSPIPAHQNALTAWRTANKEYGDAAKQIGKSGDKGNATGQAIQDASDLTQDNLVTRIANSPSAVREADRATTPMFRATNENAMGKLRRERADDLIDRSQTQHRWNQNERIVNPDTLERKLADKDGMQELLAPASLELQDNIKLGKAIVGPSKLTNTSNTARFMDAQRLATTGVGAALGGFGGASYGDGDAGNMFLGALGGSVAAPYAISKAVTSPRFYKAAVNGSPGPLQSGMAPMFGAATRGLMEMQTLPVPSLEEEQAARPVRFKISEIQ